MQMIQMAYMDRMYNEIKADVLPKMEEFISSGKYILGDYVRTFEKNMTARYRFPHSMGMANGTDALMIALRAAGVSPGDEVIVPAFTIFIDGAVVRMLGAIPQFVEVNEDDFNLDPSGIEKAITPKTKAILAIHLFGQCADMPAIMKVAKSRGIAVIEDACQAIGAKVGDQYAGNLGDAGCFSFYPTKNLGGAGDGGFASCQSKEIYETMKLLHLHGVKSEAYVQDVWAYNSRLDAFQALILDSKLKYLSGWEDRRRKIARHYFDRIKNPKITLPAEKPGRHHVFHQFTVRVKDRKGFIEHLTKNNIAHAIFYPRILPNQPAYRDVLQNQKLAAWPVSEKLTNEVISIPVNPQLTDAEADHIVDALNRY